MVNRGDKTSEEVAAERGCEEGEVDTQSGGQGSRWTELQKRGGGHGSQEPRGRLLQQGLWPPSLRHLWAGPVERSGQLDTKTERSAPGR